MRDDQQRTQKVSTARSGAGASGTSSADTDEPKIRRSRGQLWTIVGIYVFLLILMFGSKAISSNFGTLSFMGTIISLSAYTAVVAFGQYVCVLTGGLDLSIPNTMAFAGVLLTGTSRGEDSRLAWAIILALVVGVVVGVVNGLGITLLDVSPVVMTLATNVILGGAVLVYTGGTPRGSSPPALREIIQGSALGPIPNIVLIVLVFAAIGIFLMNMTSFGRRVYAIGSNPRVAHLSGIRTVRTSVGVYAISGFCAALAGCMLTGYGNSSYLGMGDPYLLLSIAAVVIGGVNILGGRGLYIGVIGGALILTTLSTVLSGTNLPEAFKQIIFAVAIIAAVLVARQSQTQR